MFIIGLILTLISAAGCGACILGYFIDFSDTVVIVVAVAFAFTSILSMISTLTDYRNKIENDLQKENAN